MTPDGLAFAEQAFAKAKPGSHPITAGSVQAILDAAKNMHPAAATADKPAVVGGPIKAPMIEDPAKPPAHPAPASK